MARNQGSNRNLCDWTPLNGASGDHGEIELMRGMTDMVVSLFAGSLSVWFGAWPGAGASPHLYFNKVGEPLWVPLPNNVQRMSYALGASPTQGSLILLGGGADE